MKKTNQSRDELIARVGYAINDLNKNDAHAIVELVELLAEECVTAPKSGAQARPRSA